ncbi:hypothetical protein OQA88_6808 [Cercophora sp. LCS_1]
MAGNRVRPSNRGGAAHKFRDPKPAPTPVRRKLPALPWLPARYHTILGDEYAQLDDDDLETDFVIKQIEKQYYCEISHAPYRGPNAIKILACVEKDFDLAIKALERVLKIKNDEGDTWITWVLLYPLIEGHEDRMVTMELKDGSVGARPVAEAMPPGPISFNFSPTVAAEMVYRKELEKTIEAPFNNLRNAPHRMRMRVRFGTLSLQQWTKGKTTYTYPELEKLTLRAGPRGTAQLDVNVCDPNKVESLHQKLSDNSEFVSVAGGVKVYAVKPVHSVVVMTKNLVVESIIESSFTKAPIGQAGKEVIDNYFGPFQVYRTETQPRTMQIITACPEDRFDWMLEVIGMLDEDEVKLHVPFGRAQLKKSINFTGELAGGAFPVFKVSPGFEQVYGVGDTYGKVTWTYALSSFYSVEISLLHKMGTDGTHEVHGVGAALFAPDWDTKMDLANLLLEPRSWISFMETFLMDNRKNRADYKTTTVPWTGLFCWIQTVQNILDVVNREAKKESEAGIDEA